MVLDRRSKAVRDEIEADRESGADILAGLVERVTFHNEENGFAVLRVKARGKRDLVTVVGHAAVISAGEFIQASGDWNDDRQHGLQFRARFLKAMPPTTIEGIEKYLGSGMIRGIGPVYAKKLVRAFGEKVFDIIETTPDRLREVEGIGPVRAASISANKRSARLLASRAVRTAVLHRARRTNLPSFCAPPQRMPPAGSRLWPISKHTARALQG